ncbi:MAG TPA: Ran-binding zinc finger domain-containing protein [Gemmatimonadaceae bacterium]|jgi:hypothetical protein|nr:Ran-binding zinc finger domain-containing protein [Gemmatimonadaceae bacterium]
MSSGLNSMDELNALMEERARYEQWLEQLNARKGSTPPHVFERVRGDYGERLNRVLDQLAGRATELQETAGTLADRVAALFADETSLRDERAEAELRAAVGEFTEEHAREVVHRCDEAIASLGAERASVGAELGRVQEILAVATRPPTPPAGEPNVVPIEALAPPAPPAHAASPNGGAPARSAQPPLTRDAAPSQFDELAFLQSVVDKPAPPASAASPADVAPPDARTERSAPSPSRAPARENVPQSAPEPVAAAPSRRAAAPTPILTSAPLVEKDGHEANAALTPGSIPAFLKDVPTEQIKTLKCQECGTMNYPTEWYCERCGGELAAM